MNGQCMNSELMTLYVDLDGTLVKTDLLLESAWSLIRQNPLRLFQVLWWRLSGKAALKAEIASRVSVAAANLPYNKVFVEWLRLQAANGRQLVLASASNQRLAYSVAAHLGIFSAVIASNNDQNLAGAAKLRAIQRHAEDRPWVYAANARVDVDVWRGAAGAVVVNPGRGVEAAARQVTRVEAVFATRSHAPLVWLEALRLHQWLKNLLTFVPLLTSFALGEGRAVLAAMIAFVAFGLVASATYLFNDLNDLDADRRHARKRHRALAAGDISIVAGASASVVLLATGLLVGSLLPAQFMVSLLAYLLGTVAYSLHLKRLMLLDVICLAGLYTVRIIAGALAIGVSVSNWLLAFSVFLFLSLALIKRCAELVALQADQQPSAHGRDYRSTDLPVFMAMGICAAFMSVLVLALYVDASSTLAQYSHPRLLWLLSPLILYWIGRLWVKTARGEMHDDPLVYSLRDRTSWLCFVVMVTVATVSR